MKYLRIFVVFIFFFVISHWSPTLVFAQTTSEWSTTGANSQRTSWLNLPNPPTHLNLEVAIPIDAYIDQRVQIITAGNLIYLATAKGLYAIDPNPGQYDRSDPTQPWVKWRFETALPLGNSPTIFNNVAYVPSFDHSLYALNAQTGTLLWENHDATAGYDTNPLVIEDAHTNHQPVVILGNRDGKLYAIGAQGHPQAGQTLWSYDTGSSIQMSAAYASDTGAVYFAALNNYLYAVDITSGSEVWKTGPTPSDGYSSYWPVVYQNYVIFPTTTKKIYQVDGTNNWGRLCPWRAERYGTVEERQNFGFGYPGIYPGTLSGNLIDQSLWPTWSNGFPVLDISQPLILAKPLDPYYNGVNPPPEEKLVDCYEQLPSGETDVSGHKPWYRMQVMLDRTTGQEFTFDSDHDGNPEYIPVTWWGTNTGNAYPVFTEPTQSTLYFGTTVRCGNSVNGDCGDNPGKVFGWNPNQPQYLSAVGSSLSDISGITDTGARAATAEPNAFSGAGDIIYRNLCGDRIGSWFSTDHQAEGNYWEYSNNLGVKAPGYDQAWSILPGLSRLYGWYQGLHQYYQNQTIDDRNYYSTSGIYHTHGVQNPLIPYQGRIYVHRSNALIVFGPNGKTSSQALYPPLLPRDQTHSPEPYTPNLSARLQTEIQKILSVYQPGAPNRFLRPGYYVFNPHTIHYELFRNPGETLQTLSQAYLYLPDLRPQLQTYLDDFYQTYFVDHLYTNIPWKDLSPRETMDYPREFNDWLQTSNRAAAGELTIDGSLYRYPPQNLYALWQYANNTQANISSVYTVAKNILTRHGVSPRQPTCQANFDVNGDGAIDSRDSTNRTYVSYFAESPQELNAYLAGWLGFQKIHQLAREHGVTVDNALLLQVNDQLDQFLPYRTNNFYKDSFYIENGIDVPGHPTYSQGCRNIYTGSEYAKRKELDIARNFLFLTPEVATYMRDHSDRQSYSNAFSALTEYQAVAPYWFVSRYDAVTQEGIRSALQTYPALFQAKAWILQEPQEALIRYLDVPAFDRGDLYYIQNLVAAIEAPSDPNYTPPPTSPTQIPIDTDLDNDSDTDWFDLSILISHFHQLFALGNFNLTGLVDIFDFNTLLKNL